MSVLIQFPTLNRPDKFIRVLTKYVSQASSHWADEVPPWEAIEDLFFNINCDVDDASMNNVSMRRRIKEVFAGNPSANYQIHYDKNTDKISAINSHIDGLDFDVVVCASDDMIPQVNHWDFEIVNAMRAHFPKLDGCVHFNDGHTDGKLITFSILGRELYKHFGYIYHPDYKSLYCDNEFTQEVIRMDKVKYIDKIIVKHEHYGEEGNENSGDFDHAAQKTLHYSGRDGRVFELRQSKGFPKERVTID